MLLLNKNISELEIKIEKTTTTTQFELSEKKWKIVKSITM